MTLTPGFHAVPDGHVPTVVTFLEMTAPAAPRPDPPAEGPPEGLSLDRWPAPPGDAYRALIRAVGADWLWQAVLSASDAELRADLDDPAYAAHRLMRDGEAAGIVDLDFRERGACKIAYFGVIPALTGTGAARWAMNRALASAWREGVGRVWLHTCTLDHPAALAFYRRTGFVPTRQEVEVVPDPRLRGLVPVDAAPHIPLAVAP